MKRVRCLLRQGVEDVVLKFLHCRMELRLHWVVLTTLILALGHAQADEPGKVAPRLVFQDGHARGVTTVAWSPDGKTIATASDDATAKLWDANTWRLLATLAGHESEIGSLAWSPDSRFFATGSSDDTVRVWEAQTGKLVSTLRDGNNSGIYTLAWSPDGSQIASAQSNNTIGGLKTVKLWDVAGKQLMHTKELHAEVIDAVAWSPSGRQVAAGARDGSIKVFDVKTLAVDLTLKGHTNMVSSVEWSPDGQTLATAGYDGVVKLWGSNAGELRNEIKDPRSRIIKSMKWSPDGRLLALGTGYSGPYSIDIWDTTSGTQLTKLEGQSDDVLSVSWSPSGKQIAGASGNSAKVWDVEQKRLVADLKGRAPSVSASAWSPDGELFAAGCENGEVKLWDKTTGTLRATLKGHSAAVLSLDWSPEGKFLATGSADSTAKIWERDSGKLKKTISTIHSNTVWPVNSLDWHPNGNELVFGVQDGTVKLWDKEGDVVQPVIGMPDTQIRGVAWSPDGMTLAAGGGEKVVLWDRASEKEILALQVNPGFFGVDALAWSPDGRTLATAAWALECWDVQTGKLLWAKDASAPIAWKPDGRALAAGRNGAVALWDPADGEVLQSLGNNMNGLASLCWSPDGKVLTSTHQSRTDFWNPESGENLLTVVQFESEDDWLVTTAEGFFDGSRGGWSKILWRMSADIREVVAPEQFFLEFFQPGLFRDVFSHGKPKPITEVLRDRGDARANLTIVSKDRRSVRVSFGRSLIDNPERDKRMLDIPIHVREAPPDSGHTSGSGLKDLRLFRNGTLVWRSTPGEPLESGDILVKDIPLVAGENRLLAYAFNSDNIKSQDAALTVVGDRSLAREARAHVLAIGIDRYADPKLNLRYAGSDARDLATALSTHLPIPSSNIEVRLLTDEQATKAKVLGELEQLRRVAAPEDIVIVFFAGHGIRHADHFYLVCHDQGPLTSMSDLASHGIGDQQLESHFTEIQAAHIALIIDSCYSGKALEAAEWRVGPMNSRGLPQLAWEKGMEILAASQSDETAKELDRFGHGLLTHSLLRALEEAPREDGLGLFASDWLDHAAQGVSGALGTESEETERVAVLEGVEAGQFGPAAVQTPRVFHGREGVVEWLVAK